MREVEDRRWKIEGGKLRSSVNILVIISRISGVLNGLKNAVLFVVCVSGRFVNLFWTAFTTAFTPFFETTFNLLTLSFIPTIHTTNKSDNILYKLIITN